ncbi:hypothetical protein, partial [Gelidibacter pelagius]
MKKNYRYVLQLVLLTLITGASFHTKAENTSILDTHNALYQFERSFIKTLIDEDLERSFERKNEGFRSHKLTPEALCNDITIYLDSSGNTTISPEDLDSNNTGTNFSLDIDTFDCSNIGTPVNVTVTDSSDSSTCSAIVTVEDNLPPVTPTLDDVTGECTATATAPTTTDNCGATITGTSSDPLTYST